MTALHGWARDRRDTSGRQHPVGADRRAWQRRFLVAWAALVATVVGCATDPPVSVTVTTAVTPTIRPTPTQSFLPVAPLSYEQSIEEAPVALLAAEAAAEDADVALEPTTDIPSVANTPAPSLQASNEAHAVVHTVKPGDTLIGIALEYGVPMAAIQLRNDLGDATTVWIDQELTVPQGGMWADASPFWSVYEVVAGDTLSEVAARFDLEIETLLTANGLSDGDLIAVGQPLVLPVNVSLDTLAAAPPPTAPPAPTQEPTPLVTTAPAPVAAAGDMDLSEGAQAGGAVEVVETPPPEPTVVPLPTAEDNADLSDAVPPSDTSALANEVFQRINGQRAAFGLPPLAWNATLAGAAQRHADDCYARGWCGHTGSDGSTYRERIIRAGYDPVRWSECWAWYATPERAVAMWMDEVPPNDPHRRTILSDYLTEVGVGVVPGNGHGYYFIADFGTPAN